MNNTNKKENNLFKKFAAMMWILHRYHQKNHHKAENKRNSYVKYAESRILALLKLQENIDKKDLMFILGIPKHHFEEVLGKMNTEEYISLTDSENDSTVLVKLTEKGKTAEIKTEKSEFNSIFDCLSDEERENLGQYIDTIISSVKSKSDSDSEEENGFFGEFLGEDFHGKGFRHPFFHRDREFGDFERDFDMRDERCGHGHGPHGRPDFDRNRDFRGSDRGFDMRNERCGHGHGHGPHGHPEFDRNRDFRDSERDFDMRNERCEHGHGHGPHGRPDFDRNRGFRGSDRGFDMRDERCGHGHGNFDFFNYKKR
ncbi:MarR family winged helix-turn-helix transcriptional regulator [Sebaldella sp. S0638]|uniref:MarR family winged helix-turn-helix transcriptional regulator n=1 Tax=Sebaldella sp. S0638 TaxID=2957809 RepID=UPI0020A114EC|nr:MarR family winged helix-turn-helix transcriptional regulator [Sebaldella sp. S0638]MCP1223154.1 MarR family winged helix-turn-helix transcriptional regulator [Sebaldella sp. S0638]